MGQKVYLSMKTKTMWLIAEIITTRKITFHPGKQHRFFNSTMKEEMNTHSVVGRSILQRPAKGENDSS